MDMDIDMDIDMDMDMGMGMDMDMEIRRYGNIDIWIYVHKYRNDFCKFAYLPKPRNKCLTASQHSPQNMYPKCSKSIRQTSRKPPTPEAVRRLMNSFKVDGLTRALTRQL